jgi:glucose/arabinose dehydrogenase
MRWMRTGLRRGPSSHRDDRHIRFRPALDGALEDRRLLAALPAGFVETTVASGLSRPTAMEVAPDGRIFVAQQGGALRVIKGGQLLPAPFLSLNVDSTGERGLLGIAFDPDFATNQFVYVYYTVPGSPAHNRVSRFTASGDVAAAGSERPILDLDPLSGATNHNGGAIHFGIDGKLYVAVGENANGANAQTLNNRLGKVLRINPDGSIPQDNPFVGVATGANQSIWALGLRNPFTFAVQPGTGVIFINDVGQLSFEEIDRGIPGANYGWPDTEGPTNDPRFVSPIFAYPRSGAPLSGFAITGGTFYNPAAAQFPADFVGDYFFADLSGNFLARLDPATGSATAFATALPPVVVDLKVDAAGSLYYLAQGTGNTTGVLVRIDRPTVQPPPGQGPAIAREPADAFSFEGGSVTFSVEATGAAPLSFQWQKDGVAIPGATGASFTIPSVSAADFASRFRVIVTNASGSATSREALLVGPSPFVQSLYLDILRRPADPGGLASWSLALAQGTAPAQVASAFLNSPERLAGLVVAAHQGFLGRPPDPTELNAGLALLASGGSVEDVQARVLGSQAYFLQSGRTPRGFLRSLTQDVLGRDPTRRELALLRRRALTPAARLNLARAFLADASARGPVVSAFYNEYLHRPASPSEVSFWVGQLGSGLSRAQLEAIVVTSPEYLARSPAIAG